MRLTRNELISERPWTSLDKIEADARWIVGQYPRLQDESVKTIALNIVAEVESLRRSALAALDAADSGEAT